MKRIIIIIIIIVACLLVLSCEAADDDDRRDDGDSNDDCCKVCHDGKACGDTCIFQGDTCYEEPGCACNGRKETPKPYCGDGNCDSNEYERTVIDGIRICQIKCGADCDMEDFCD